jgi:hypothetical protein
MGPIAARFETYNAENPYPGASEHDSGQILTGAEVVALKQELLSGDEQISKLAGWIISGLLESVYEEDAQSRADETTCYASTVPQDPESRAEQFAQLLDHWTTYLVSAVKLPSDEWPEGMVAPSSLASWLEEMNEESKSETEPTEVS